MLADLRLLGRRHPQLLKRKELVPGRSICHGLVVHTARFDHRLQLTCAVKIQRQIIQIVHAHGQSSRKNDHQKRDQRPFVFVKKWNGFGH
ncbi:hypothetical protein SDC9_91162 [bioreactor metagenome]|uniref:Uncharacterized protein n=1 Tax=bioreactor metagenome TaxID=1076179 RepID=A0A645A3X5_9ZZZZ